MEVMDCFVMSVGWIDSSEEGSDSKDCSSDSDPARSSGEMYGNISIGPNPA